MAEPDLRNDLAEFVEDPATHAHLILGWRREGALRLLRSELQAPLPEEFLDIARDEVTRLRDQRLLIDPYDPEWDLKSHEYFELAGDEVPGDALFDGLDDFLNLEKFNRAQLTRPQFYVVAAQKQEERAYFGRRMAGLKVLTKKGKGLTAIWDGDTFNQFEDSVATFADTFDWIVFRDRLYVLDKNGFHALFRDVPALRAAVEGHLQTITAKLPIQGADILVERCQASVPLASKLARVAENGIWPEGRDTLKDYAAKFDLEVQWDDAGLVFDGRFGSDWQILKLLDEDRTEGPVSGRHFDSSSKREVGG